MGESTRPKFGEVKKVVREEVSKEVEEQLPSVVTTAIEAKFGVLPSADELEKCESILPGFTDRMLKIAERDQRDETSKHARRDTFSFITLIFSITVAFLIITSFVVAGVFLIYNDKNLFGMGVLLSAAVIIWQTVHNAKVTVNKVEEEKAPKEQESEPSTEDGTTETTITDSEPEANKALE
jgi:uncharacterized membrane protein